MGMIAQQGMMVDAKTDQEASVQKLKYAKNFGFLASKPTSIANHESLEAVQQEIRLPIQRQLG